MSVSARPSPLVIWFRAARPRTLPAALAPVVVGSAFAVRAEAFWPITALICLLFAILIQIGTNFANDYFDYVKGADTAERVGPARAVASGWVEPDTMKWAMILTFLAAFAIGVTLWPHGGWPLLIIGVLSILSGLAYTGGPYPLGYNGWGDVFVFVFFGLVAVGSTYFVQTGAITTEVLAAGAAVGALATNILVVNNYRDAQTDAKAGKRTLVVRWGRPFARLQFTSAHLVAQAVPALLAFRGYSPWVLLPFLLLPWAFSQISRLQRETEPAALIALLGECGLYLATYALLLSAGVLWIDA